MSTSENTFDSTEFVDVQQPYSPISPQTDTSSYIFSFRETSTPVSEPTVIAPRHPTYYFQDEMTVFLVDGHLFKVHRWFLERHSPVFRSMFYQRSPDLPDGKTDDSPILLANVTCKEFESLLNFFYLSIFDREVPLDECLSLLKVSQTYMMHEIHWIAIEEISDRGPAVPAVEKIVLATKHSIPQWLQPAYVELCRRPEALTESEGVVLGLATTVKVLKARERFQNDLGGGPDGSGWDSTVSAIVKEIFGRAPMEETSLGSRNRNLGKKKKGKMRKAE